MYFSCEQKGKKVYLKSLVETVNKNYKTTLNLLDLNEKHLSKLVAPTRKNTTAVITSFECFRTKEERHHKKI